MKAILSVALVLGVGGLAVGDDKANPVGTWKCEYTIGDMKRESELTVKKDGDTFAGTMSWADQKDAKLKDLKFKDGELTFSAVRRLMDNEIAVEYKLKVEGDKLTGKGAVDAGGMKTEFDITAKRQKKDK
jgi:hypothetical protein